MKLLTNDIRRRLPPLYATDGAKAPLAQVKFFTPWTNWTWYAVEFDGKTSSSGSSRDLSGSLATSASLNSRPSGGPEGFASSGTYTSSRRCLANSALPSIHAAKKRDAPPLARSQLGAEPSYPLTHNLRS